MSDTLKIKRSKQLDEAMRILTDGTFSKMTGNKVKKLTTAQAAALLGNYIHETGSPDLSNLDVIEQGSGRGRGIAQYTGARRGPYDRVMGNNPNRNSISAQLKYAAEEYAGKYDQNGKSLIGYTKSLENIPKGATAAVDHLLHTYFRPADPSASRGARLSNAQQIERLYAPKPQPQQPPQPQQHQQPNVFRNVLSILGNLGLPIQQ